MKSLKRMARNSCEEVDDDALLDKLAAGILRSALTRRIFLDGEEE